MEEKKKEEKQEALKKYKNGIKDKKQIVDEVISSVLQELVGDKLESDKDENKKDGKRRTHDFFDLFPFFCDKVLAL